MCAAVAKLVAIAPKAFLHKMAKQCSHLAALDTVHNSSQGLWPSTLPGIGSDQCAPVLRECHSAFLDHASRRVLLLDGCSQLCKSALMRLPHRLEYGCTLSVGFPL